jgi:hypothetical protein
MIEDLHVVLQFIWAVISCHGVHISKELYEGLVLKLHLKIDWPATNT